MDLLLESLKNGLIVSCQALYGEPLYSEAGGIMPLVAKAVLAGGAVGIRANTPRDIREIRAVVDLPIIGLYKRNYEGYEPYITPTLKEVEEVIDAGAEIVSIDCTNRPRADGISLKEAIYQIKRLHPKILIMADISNYEEGKAAFEYGADIIATTLNGYTPYTISANTDNYELVSRLSKACKAPVFAEGRIHYPCQAAKMLEAGAWSVVVGGAITRPEEITRRFVNEMKEVYV